jgi:putative ubiquitin-RnfH superfamily antitoxin RatB of RatAB toxin-antitoxin module
MSEIAVSVVYALPDRGTQIELRLPSGATVADAIQRSGLAGLHPEVDTLRCPVGIFGRRVQRYRVLADGDRVELYRPLLADPKDARRHRARRRPSD